MEEELRNSEEWRPKKAVNEHTNIESVILFEDIEPFLMIMEKNNDFSGEVLNNFLDFIGKTLIYIFLLTHLLIKKC